MQTSTNEKPCTRCGKTLPLSAFAPDKRLKSGVGSRCRECKLALHKEWRDRDPEHQREYSRARFAADPERFREANRRCYEAHKAERNAKAREWALKNPSRVKEIQRNWQSAHRDEATKRKRAYRRAFPEKTKERAARYAERHPDRVRAIWNSSRAKRIKKIRNSTGVTASQWEAIVEWFGRRCAYCFRAPRVLTVEHVIPLSHPDGWHEPENVVPACRSCNSRKHVRPVWAMLNG